MKQERVQIAKNGQKKVLFLITKSNWGGAQRYVYDLATNLDRERFETVVAFGGTGAAGALPGLLKTQLDEAGIRTFMVPSFMRDVSLVHEVRLWRELRDLMRTERPDIVHLNSSKAGAWGAVVARIVGVPRIVFTVHGVPWDEDRSLFARTAIFLISWMTFLLCHQVITVTKNNYDRVRRLPFCSRRTRLIHNGIDAYSFQILPRTEARKLLDPGSSHTDTLWVGTIAELTPNKNIAFALDAFARTKASEPQTCYCIIGDGEERERLQSATAALAIEPDVIFARYVPDASRLLSAFDIFFLPSMKEGLPYVLLEAGLAGVPVIASNVGGIPDLIEDGVSGVLIDPKNSAEAAASLAQLAMNLHDREKCAVALRKHVEADFCLVSMLKMTSEIYLTQTNK